MHCKMNIPSNITILHYTIVKFYSIVHLVCVLINFKYLRIKINKHYNIIIKNRKVKIFNTLNVTL